MATTPKTNGKQLTGNFWDNPANYKPCRKKFHDVYMCKPPVGTIVINKLINPDVVKAVGKAYFTVEELQKIAGTQLYAALQGYVQQKRASITDKYDYVICGTVGELYTVQESDIVSYYQMFRDGNPININQDDIRQHSNNDGTINWTLIRPSPATISYSIGFALFVPVNKRLQIPVKHGVANVNAPGVSHGKGDFIVCDRTPGGTLKVETRRVVNGEVFATMYNNQGWQDCLASTVINMSIEACPVLFTKKDKPIEVSDKEPRFVKELQAAFVRPIQSGTAVSYDPTTSPEIVTQFSEAYVAAKFSQAGIPADSGALIAFYIMNRSDILTVMFDKPRKHVLILSGDNYRDGVKLTMKDQDDFEFAKAVILMLSCLQPRGFLSGFRHVPVSAQEAQGFKMFTDDAYTEINDAMYAGKVSELSFSNWLASKMMYSTLNRCQLKGVRLFRGMNFDDEPCVGQVIKLNSFTSWSLSYSVTKGFSSKYTFMVKVTSPIHAVYINSLSEYRDSEFEVIINAGYKIKIQECIKCNNSKLFICVIAVDEQAKAKLDTAFERESDESADWFSETLANNVIANQDVGGVLYMVYNFVKPGIRCETVFANKFGDQNRDTDVVRVKLETQTNKISIIYFVGGEKKQLDYEYKSFDQAIAETMQKLEGIVKQLDHKTEGSVYAVGQQFMFNIAARFENEGFQLIRQQFDAKREVKDTLHGVVVISGDNDDNIALRFRVTSDMKIAIIAQSQNIKLKHEFDATDDKLYDNIFNTVVRKFKLSQWRRIERALNLVAQYKRTTVKTLSKDNHSASYEVAGRQVIVTCDGNTVVFNATHPVSFNYFDNLRTMAAGIADQF